MSVTSLFLLLLLNFGNSNLLASPILKDKNYVRQFQLEQFKSKIKYVDSIMDDSYSKYSDIVHVCYYLGITRGQIEVIGGFVNAQAFFNSNHRYCGTKQANIDEVRSALYNLLTEVDNELNKLKKE